MWFYSIHIRVKSWQCLLKKQRELKMTYSYTYQQFGKELKEQVKNRVAIDEIGAWAHDQYYDHIFEIDPNSGLRTFLLQLGTMEMGPEFELSYEELDAIADRLIAGEKVAL